MFYLGVSIRVRLFKSNFNKDLYLKMFQNFPGSNLSGDIYMTASEYLKVHECRFENLSIRSYSHENNLPKIWHLEIFYFLRYAHVRYVKCLFTNIQKQQNVLRISVFKINLQISRLNSSRILRIKDAKFSGY